MQWFWWLKRWSLWIRTLFWKFYFKVLSQRKKLKNYDYILDEAIDNDSDD